MNTLSRFPSYNRLLAGAIATFARFPFTLLSAILGTVVGVCLTETERFSTEHMHQKLLMVAALGLPLFTALTAYAEKVNWSKIKSIALQSAGAILLVLYYFSLPADVSDPYYPLVRFTLLVIGLHFLAAWLPWVGGNQINGFWQYNKSLFLRFLTAALYSSVIYIGLTIALASADHLFGFVIDPKRYMQLWIIVTGTFHTWIFLGGIPRNLGELDGVVEYPKGLKVFTQFVLLPLVALYFVILIAYEAKIVITWNWPKGWVSQMVLWYSVVGILSLLLLHPMRTLVENKWIQVFAKWFYRALVPLVLMLFLAIVRRISDYGITENRYFVLAMAIGLAIVVVYFVISKVRDIRIIPIVLCALAFLSAYGPWSAFSISKSSQQGRLEALMMANGILVDGSIQKAPDEVSWDDRREMSNVVEYLDETHGVPSFSHWLPDSVLDSIGTLASYDRPKTIVDMMGFVFSSRLESPGSGTYFSFSVANSGLFRISNYDHLIEFKHSGINVNRLTETHLLDNDSCFVEFVCSELRFGAHLGTRTDGSSRATTIHIADALDSLIAHTEKIVLPMDAMTFLASGIDLEVKLIIRDVSGWKHQDSLEISSINALLLIRKH